MRCLPFRQQIHIKHNLQGQEGLIDAMHILALEDEHLALVSIVQELAVVFPQAKIQQKIKPSVAIS